MFSALSRTKCFLSALFTLASFMLLSGTAVADACVDCHKNPNFRTQNKKLYDYYNDWISSTHKRAGVSCADCHGGDPNAELAEAAHNGGFLPANPNSDVHYKKLPATCGKCHQSAYQEFTQSKHFKALMNELEAPHCATCHGSINSKVYYTSIVDPTCNSCHNNQRAELPRVSEQAEEILQRLNIAKAYMGWTELYYKQKNWPAGIDEYRAEYQAIADAWHRFKLAETDEVSTELLSRLKVVFDEAWEAHLLERKQANAPTAMGNQEAGR